MGVEVTVQGRRDAGLLSLDERRDTWNNPYFWLAYRRTRSEAPEGTDLWAVATGRISVTPLSMELSHRASIEAARKALT